MSPSIDILVSSNLERLLWLASGGNGALVGKLFTQLAREKHFSLLQHGPEGSDVLRHLRSVFSAGWASEEQTLSTIRDTFSATGVLLDPHTAVAKHVADQYRADELRV